jgi:hypothetical protein
MALVGAARKRRKSVGGGVGGKLEYEVKMRVIKNEVVIELPDEVREMLERFEDIEIDDNAKPSLLVIKLKSK